MSVDLQSYSQDTSAEKSSHATDPYNDPYTETTHEVEVGVGGVGRTQRRLTARHVTFIGFGGGIGTGLFIGTGSALAKAGPAGLLLAYIIVGGVLWCVMECLGELATLVSHLSASEIVTTRRSRACGFLDVIVSTWGEMERSRCTIIAPLSGLLLSVPH
jgi:amino acid permease